MAKDRAAVICNGKAALYATIWEDIRNAAMDCGWAVALHGSLARDMDIMAMPWVENSTDADTMIQTIVERCFGENMLSKHCTKCHKNIKLHNRVCYTIPIWAEHYLDISIIQIDK